MPFHFYKLLNGLCLLGLMASTSLLAQGNQELSPGLIFNGEPFLAQNPQNPQELTVAWMGYKPGSRKLSIKTRTSLDGGDTWQGVLRLPHVQSGLGAADPTMAYDAQGTLYLAYIDFDRPSLQGGIYLRRSSDAGLTWQTPTTVMTFADDPGKYPVDRPWLQVGPGIGGTRVYITSMTAEGAQPPFHPYLHVSDNGGQSFRPWRYLDTAAWQAGSLIPLPMPTPAVAADGDFYAAYPSYVPGQLLPPQFVLAHSRDGGRSVQHRTLFAGSGTSAGNDSLSKKAYLLRADPADSLHLAFFYFNSPQGHMDLFLRESYDGGRSWGGPVRINDDSLQLDRMQDMVWADFDADGDLVVAWRDRRNAPSSGYQTASEIMAAFRPADSTAFGANFPLSDSLVPYDSILASAGNDFLSVSLHQDTLHAVWGAVRKGWLDIWYERRSLPGQQVSRQRLSARPELEVYPVPARNGRLKISSAQALQEIRLYDLGGGKTLRQWQGKGRKALLLEVAALPPGSYGLEAQAVAGQSLYRRVVIR
ncbi:MAG: sialidase family protein [Schleiferiaceae bacterium]|nr:sialidase family protein [Schleiferiaceae bacterium]